jgi:hypothetical protein
MYRQTLASFGASLALTLALTGAVAQAQGQGQNPPSQNQGGGGQNQGGGGQNQQGPNNNYPNPAATPEAETFILYALGILGVGGMTVLLRRRQQERSGPDASG